MQSDVQRPTDSPTSHATMNKLRAAVLGANDGIVSTSSVLMGVAGATSDRKAILTAGLAALVAGALSMAVGEYVSVSSQRDAEKASVQKSGREAKDHEHEFVSPSQAAVASFVAFTIGGLIPFVAILASPAEIRIPVTVLAVLIALLITGFLSATVGGAPRIKAMARVIAGGLLAMAITYFVGALFGASLS